MNLNMVIIVITFVTSILIISSSQISFAKKNDKEEEEEEDGEDIKKDILVFSLDKPKKIDKDSKETTEVQNDIMNDHYPNKYYFCGYPQQLVTDYNSFEKVNCN